VHSSLGGVYNNIGMIYVRQGELEQAASVLASAVEHQRIAFN
jgi:Flp pilus assembly protein TadD